MRSPRSIIYLVLAVVVSLGLPQALAHDEEVLLVGRNGAGEVIVDSDFDQPVELPVSIFAGIPGYATGELAFHSTILDEPTNDFFQLSPAADFRLILLAKDPGMELWNGSGYMAIGESYYIGPSPFDSHPIWNIVNGTPGDAYSLTLKLHDLNDVYPDSEPFELSFTPIEVRHRINIAQVDALHATLTWTTNAVGWELQSASTAAAVNWDTVTNTPMIAGTNFVLNITTGEAQQYFRLHQQ